MTEAQQKVEVWQSACAWREDEDGNWDTSCDNKHILFDGRPSENGMKFCCYCGGALTEVEWREVPE